MATGLGRRHPELHSVCVLQLVQQGRKADKDAQSVRVAGIILGVLFLTDHSTAIGSEQDL